MTPIPSASFDDEALFQLGTLARDAGYSFTTVTPATHALVNARPQNSWARDLDGVLGWSRPFVPEILSPPLWEALQAARVVQQEKRGFRCLVRLSSLGDSLFFHSAFPTLDADAVFFGPDTYRFALSLENHWKQHPQNVRRAVDIGTGAGPGALWIARRFPNAQVWGADINRTALRFAAVNARLNQIFNFRACESDLLGGLDGDFDLIVANPPYLVDEHERSYRHGGGPLGTGLSSAILDVALERLTTGGTLVLYTGAAMQGGADPFLETVRVRLRSFQGQWSYREIDPDIFGEELQTRFYSDCDRIAAVVLTLRKA